PTGADLVGGVFNTGSGRWYCTIGAAVADAGAGDTLQVREGTYAENVVIDRALTLHGPHHGTPGADASRGNGEAVIAAGSGQALRINADNVVVSGLTFTGLGGEPASVAVASGGNYGGPASHVEIRDNRFAGLHGTAIYTNGPMFVDGWDVHHNLVDGLSSEYPYSGINLWRAANSSIHDNVIRN